MHQDFATVNLNLKRQIRMSAFWVLMRIILLFQVMRLNLEEISVLMRFRKHGILF